MVHYVLRHRCELCNAVCGDLRYGLSVLELGVGKIRLHEQKVLCSSCYVKLQAVQIRIMHERFCRWLTEEDEADITA